MLPTVNSDGSRNMPRRSRAWALARATAGSCAAITGLLNGSDWRLLLRGLAVPAVRRGHRQRGQNALPALDALAGFHSEFRIGGKNHVDPRTEFDQAHPLAALQPVAFAGIEDDAPGQQSGNLLERHFHTLPAHRGNVLLVASRRRLGSWRSGIGLSGSAPGSTLQQIGERFTCTSKTLRNMEIRWRGPSGVEIVMVSVTRPSPGDTINPGPVGMVRWGSRKNHRKKAASSTGAIPHAQWPVAHTRTTATANKAQTVDVTVTNHSP